MGLLANNNQAMAEPAFVKIDYKGVNCINYISDFTALDASKLRFLQSLNSSVPASSERRQQSKYDNITSNLQRKILRQGFVERPSAVSKKGKKGDADFNYYNTNDNFIDDQDVIEKKDIFSQYHDYQCLPLTSLQELYNSPLYKSKAEEVVSESLKRQGPHPEFNPDNEEEMEKFDEIKKKIKNNIKEYINKASSPHPNPSELPTTVAAHPILIEEQPRGSKQELIVIEDDPSPQ